MNGDVRDMPTGDDGAPLGPLTQPGYYPGFRTLDQQHAWDEATRAVVLARVADVPNIRFFSVAEAELLECICARVLPQDDRSAARRIPIVPWIDERLFTGRSDGYRYDDMPPDPDAYRAGLAAIDAMAHDVDGNAFSALNVHDAETLLRSVHDGKPLGSAEPWSALPPHRFWMLLVSDCAEAYYSHPWAWDEIGFGGPAYPRAYMRLERGEPEPWETHERRYVWHAPAASVSDTYEPVGGSTEQHGSPGQGGTH